MFCFEHKKAGGFKASGYILAFILFLYKLSGQARRRQDTPIQEYSPGYKHSPTVKHIHLSKDYV
jgi:hypothetical protein